MRRRCCRSCKARWRSTVESGGELTLDEAVLLAADLFDVIEREAPSVDKRVHLLRQVYEAAAAALYLFGAAQVLKHGSELIAVFRPDVRGLPQCRMRCGAPPRSRRRSRVCWAAPSRSLNRRSFRSGSRWAL